LTEGYSGLIEGDTWGYSGLIEGDAEVIQWFNRGEDTWGYSRS